MKKVVYKIGNTKFETECSAEEIAETRNFIRSIGGTIICIF